MPSSQGETLHTSMAGRCLALAASSTSLLLHYRPQLEIKARLRAIYFCFTTLSFWQWAKIRHFSKNKPETSQIHVIIWELLSLYWRHSKSSPGPFESVSRLLKGSRRPPLSHRFSRVAVEITQDFAVSWIQTGNRCVVFKLRFWQTLTDGDVNKEAVVASGEATVGMQSLWVTYLKKQAKLFQAREKCARA